MAPFGKNFLKARLKNRTKDVEPVVGKEIQVTVCNEEKVVCGVTKHTTCADMIQALLDDHKSIPESKRLLHGEPKDFCLVERWKGFERALPPLTRILRLWYAWGDQRSFIQFILVKTSDFVPQTPKKAVKAKGARPKRWDNGRGQYSQSLPVEKQKRMVKKAFRKLEKLHKESKSSPGSEEIDRMVQLILNQDHTIREQLHHLRDLDLGIENFEQQLQSEADCASSLAQACGPTMEIQSEEQLQEYLYISSCSNGVEQLEMQIQRHRELIFQLSKDIDGELQMSNSSFNQEEGSEWAGAAGPSMISSDTADESLHIELQNLHDELKHSIFAGVSLQKQAADMEKQLKYFDNMLVSKDEECWQLAAQLNSLLITDGAEEKRAVLVPLKSETQCSISQTVKLKHSLSPLDVTDTDSDTGISSTHSQDSLSPCLELPPPLDTDV
ncbi:ras association domain-containing protein 9 [Gouania willdenowi]|uniref:Ras-associating domain-containing protein n=1 Tax=Gouania willdenowi TaxID=441366 RepID=A0A8C5EAR4_GOUWI|nr:ras association domain-containing protein 9 [Gouania willdenowi]